MKCWLARRINGPNRQGRFDVSGSRPRASPWAHGPRVCRVAGMSRFESPSAIRCARVLRQSSDDRTRIAASHTRTDAPPSPAPMPCASRADEVVPIEQANAFRTLPGDAEPRSPGAWTLVARVAPCLRRPCRTHACVTSAALRPSSQAADPIRPRYAPSAKHHWFPFFIWSISGAAFSGLRFVVDRPSMRPWVHEASRPPMPESLADAH